MPAKGSVRTKTTIGSCPVKSDTHHQNTYRVKLNNKSVLYGANDKYNQNNNSTKRYICSICGLQINSIESLKVHMQYQHEDMNRWGVPTQSVQPSTNNNSSSIIHSIQNISTTATSSSSSTTATSKVAVTSTSLTASTIGDAINNNVGGGNNTGATLNNSTSSSASRSPTDSENNNQPANKHLHQAAYGHHIGKINSPLQANNTVSAAADSSDNQPATPQATSLGNGPTSVISHITPVDHHNQLNPQLYSSANSQYLPQEMHPYPSYMHSYDQFYHPPPGMDYSQGSLYASNQMPAAVTPHQEYKLVPSSRYHPYLNNSNNNGNGNNNSSNSHLQQQQISQHNTNSANSNGNNTNTSSSISNSSLSPRVVSSSSPTQNSILGQAGQDTSMSQMNQGQPTPSPSPKQCDKCGMVCQTNAQLSEHYSTAHGVQTSSDTISRTAGEESDIQSQYPYQPYVKEEPGSDILDLDSQKMVYPPQHDSSNQDQPLPPMHSMHPMHRPIMWGTEIHSGYMPHPQNDLKQPYYSPIKQPYPSIKQEYGIKQEYPSGGNFGNQIIKSEYNQTMSQANRTDISKFQTDITTATPVSSSPSEFPSTTTPQDNGPQFRGFEPPTSSLPSNAPTVKSTTWKSNEARRPKTYNCTACNKWFTSSGHLKRHYNTTLHKNAVKSSGQPDPATLPISVHHHPSRDPNSKHHRNQARQPPPAPPEPPRSPEYTPQYTPPPGGFSQPPQSFQQYTTSMHPTANGHPNEQAGPSVHASQQRGLLIISTMEAASSNLEQEEQIQHNQQQDQEREEQYHQLILEQGSHLNLASHNLETQHQPQPVHIISMSPHHHRQDIISTIPTTTIHSTMDQQRYIISPLAINTTTHTTNTIPSFQHLQHPVEPLPSYHTIIGNDSSLTSNSSDGLLQLSSYDMHSTSPSSQNIHFGTSLTSIPVQQLQTIENGQHFTSIAQLNNSVVEIHRVSAGGIAQEDINQPFSPVVPESLIRCVPLKCERSPQEADVAPLQSIATQPPPSFPYSPTISSTVTSSLPSSVIITQQEVKKPAAKRKRSVTTKSTKVEDQSLKNTNTSTTPSTPPKIECIECGKEFAKACYLTQHNKTFHSGEQPFRCQKCGKRFQCQQTYDTHLDKHKAQDKPFKCDKCPKQFHHKTDLRRHRDGHTGYKAHVCDTCSKGFCRKDHLRKHSDTHKPKPNKTANNNAVSKIISIKKEIIEAQ